MIEATYIDHMGTDLTVANAARVSFGKQSEMDTSDVWGPPTLKDKDAKLIQYLAKHKHISPFGHCFASFHIKAPVFVARQLVKHKFLRWNEISRRYVDEKPEFYVPTEWRGKSADKKQGSSSEVVKMLHWIIEDPDLSVDGHTHYDNVSDNPNRWSSYVNKQAIDLYNAMINSGVCPEQARMVLPQSMMTEWYWSGSLDAFADMCKLRCASDTQAETQEVAKQISVKMHELFPVSWMALAKGQR
jgi:thymidylate synthase (FAD)